jgi:murein DD-endopeptidase MepM/ murein hydrolase activator NlpD
VHRGHPAFRRLTDTTVVAVLSCAVGAQAQTAYRHRDANGQWVFTDQTASSSGPAGDSFSLAHDPEALHVSVDRSDEGETTQLIASSNCLCVVTVRAKIEQSDFADIPVGAIYTVKLLAQSRQSLVTARRTAGAPAELRFAWTRALGSPEAVHTPPRPYRAPFAVGATYTVTQAYPVQITHVTPDSRYAVDIALPDGTPVYSAREGIIINVRHDSFRGAALPEMMDQANVVEILHDDGMIAVYAHLQWDSIRVRIGQHVASGEYIANSGNTGFTSGPHLHFVVWRNTGVADVSIPVQFAGLGGAPVSPVTSTPLTAY